MITRTRTYTLELRAFWVLLAVFGCLSVLYVYLVQDSVFTIVRIRSTAEQISALESDVARLESSYMTLSSNVNLELAYALGFEDSSAIMKFVAPAPSALSYAGTNDEI